MLRPATLPRRHRQLHARQVDRTRTDIIFYRNSTTWVDFVWNPVVRARQNYLPASRRIGACAGHVVQKGIDLARVLSCGLPELLLPEFGEEVHVRGLAALEPLDGEHPVRCARACVLGKIRTTRARGWVSSSRRPGTSPPRSAQAPGFPDAVLGPGAGRRPGACPRQPRGAVRAHIAAATEPRRSADPTSPPNERNLMATPKSGRSRRTLSQRGSSSATCARHHGLHSQPIALSAAASFEPVPIQRYILPLKLASGTRR